MIPSRTAIHTLIPDQWRIQHGHPVPTRPTVITPDALASLDALELTDLIQQALLVLVMTGRVVRNISLFIPLGIDHWVANAYLWDLN